MHKVTDFLYPRESYEIRGACFWVWKALGSAYKEQAVDRALTKELHKRGFQVEDQKRIPIFYETEKVGEYVPDKVVDNKIIIELKRKSYITLQDKRNFWNYLKGSPYKLGFLINFGDDKLEIKRFVFDSARKR